MSAVTVEVHGKRHTVHVKPMAPMSEVVAAALAAEKVTADPSACQLLHGKKALDLSTPLRFANFPTGAKLKLVTGKERHTGLSSHVATGTPSTLPQPTTVAAGGAPRGDALGSARPAVTAAAQRAPAEQPSGSGTAAPVLEAAERPVLQPAVSPSRPPVTPLPVPADAEMAEADAEASEGAAMAGAGMAEAEVPTVTEGAAAADSSTEMDGSFGAMVSTTNAAEPSALLQGDERLRSLLGRDSFVFSRAAEQAAANNSEAGTDLPDEFYEFTPDDLARVHRGWGSNFAPRQGGSEPLKTAKIRATEAKLAAAQAGPVPVRIVFRDGMVLQATFAAVDPVANLQNFVSRAAEPVPGLHLYTAPPKAVLHEPAASLYEACLTPAAVVYAGAPGDAVPQLRADVLALQGPPPPRERRALWRDLRQSAIAAAPAQQADGLPAHQQRHQEQQPRSASGAKLPKWLQVKK